MTDDHLYPGTVMHMILQRANGTDEHRYGTGYLGIWAKVVRCADLGLGVQFLWTDSRERRGFRRFIERMSEKAAKEKMSPATSDAATPAEDQMQSNGEIPAPEHEGPAAGCESGNAGDPAPNSGCTTASSGEPAPETDGKPRQVRDSRAGSAIVEFAFVLLTLLATIFGAIEMDRMLLVYTTLSNASRAGVRYATVHGVYRTQTGIDGPSSQASHDNVDSTVRALASAGLLDTSKLGIVVTYNVNGSSSCYSPTYNNPGCRVAVSTSYPYDPLTSFFPLQVTLRSTAQGVITF